MSDLRNSLKRRIRNILDEIDEDRSNRPAENLDPSRINIGNIHGGKVIIGNVTNNYKIDAAHIIILETCCCVHGHPPPLAYGSTLASRSPAVHQVLATLGDELVGVVFRPGARQKIIPDHEALTPVPNAAPISSNIDQACSFNAKAPRADFFDTEVPTAAETQGTARRPVFFRPPPSCAKTITSPHLSLATKPK